MHIAPEQIDSDAAKVVQRLRRYDHLAYLVGGCVRDLLLGRKPKDFDVVTSATPQEIKRLFRNCRIIGRRFRLAHIFFGPKIIETSTFRANPREVEEEEGDGPPETESGDLLIRRDNVFGTPEEDARRRDFTINGLFYNLESAEVIDHVSGMADLEARVVRTIGDPDIRFREDPIRILRAVKFAARCDLTIEPETFRRMMEHRQEITKCAQARVSEEFYRLLRAGAAKRSMELLIETELLEILVPPLGAALRRPDPDEADALARSRFWAYLAALDRQVERRPTAPSNALLLATLTLPPLRDALDPDSNAVGDVGQLVAQAIQPVMERLKASRRDAELTRQILLALRYVLPSRRPNRRRPRLAGREFLDDTLRLAELVSDAEAVTPETAGQPILGEGGLDVAPPDDDLAPELESLLDVDRRRRDGNRGRRGMGQGGGAGAGAGAGAGGGVGGGALGGGGAGTGARGPLPASARVAMAPPALLASRSIAELRAALPPRLTPDQPAFLGTGSFGGPWASRAD